MAETSQLLNDYVSRVRALFAPPAIAGEDRGEAGPVAPGQIAARAEDVLQLSTDVTRAQQEKLQDPDPRERSAAAQRLLAKAATELEISAYLKEAGQDEADAVPVRPERIHDRSVRSLGNVEEYLAVLSGNERGPAILNRSTAVAANLDEARRQLTTESSDACDFIAQLAGDTGKTAFSGLLGLGLAEVGQAVGSVISSITGAFGAGDTLSKLYSLCRDFVVKVWDSLVALIGDELAKKLVEKVSDWLKQVTDQHLFSDWLKKAYKIQDIENGMKTSIQASNRDLQRYANAVDALHQLNEHFSREMDLTKKVLRGVGYLKYVPALAAPPGLTLRAGAYAILLAWIYYDGADYLETPGQQLLSRIPGVPVVLATNLA
jgi:hypothetical protein